MKKPTFSLAFVFSCALSIIAGCAEEPAHVRPRLLSESAARVGDLTRVHLQEGVDAKQALMEAVFRESADENPSCAAAPTMLHRKDKGADRIEFFDRTCAFDPAFEPDAVRVD